MGGGPFDRLMPEEGTMGAEGRVLTQGVRPGSLFALLLLPALVGHGLAAIQGLGLADGAGALMSPVALCYAGTAAAHLGRVLAQWMDVPAEDLEAAGRDEEGAGLAPSFPNAVDSVVLSLALAFLFAR